MNSRIRWQAAGALLTSTSLLLACGGGQESNPGQQSKAPAYLAHTTPAPATTATPTAAIDLSHLYAPGPQYPIRAQALSREQAVLPGLLSTADGGYSIDPGQREAVRLFYNTVFNSADGVDMGWTGSIANCNPGTTSADYKAASLRRINWFRAMAGLPANVQEDAAYSVKAQQAALMMSANNTLSHTPSSTWTCYTAAGADGAGHSNLSLGHAGPAAIADGYMRDPGSNNAAVGHRRWVLLPQTKFMGLGDVPSTNGNYSANALWVQDANIFGSRPAVRDDFVAWPNKGYVPYQTVYPRWSFSYPAADFSAAVLSMTENGQPIATRKEQIHNGYAENTLVWFPSQYVDGDNWARPATDTVYQVTLSNVKIGGQARSFSYSVIVFDPAKAGNQVPPLSISGNNAVNAGVLNTYTFDAQSGATDYQWRSMQAATYNLDDGGEQTSDALVLKTSASYNPLATDVKASGSRSYHLASVDGDEQSLRIKAVLIPAANAQISFASRLGYATSTQNARVEVSSDEGKSWNVLWQQFGSTPESGFSSKTVSLAAYANRSIQLRWRYERGSGSFYPQSSSGIGWYVDDIQLRGFEAISSTSSPATFSGTSFRASFDKSGSALLQVRPGMYGYYGDWSDIKRITVNGVANGATTGNDLLDAQTASGGLTYNGREGLDTLRYAGASANFQIIKNSNGYQVSGSHGVDTLIDVERLQFNDKLIALDINGNAGQVYRVYQAAFNRKPDAGGLKYWVTARDQGISANDIAGGFISSAEFKTLYGNNPTTEQFVAKLYDNVLHRAYDQGGFAFWTGLLNQGKLTRAQVLASFAESAENQEGVLADIQNGITLPL